MRRHPCGVSNTIKFNFNNGKINVYDSVKLKWSTIEDSGRKCCLNCKHLEYHGKSHYESTESAGHFCDKRQSKMSWRAENEFLEKLNKIEFQLRHKNCFEPKDAR